MFCGWKLSHHSSGCYVQRVRYDKTYGTISSWRPDMKRIGTSVIDGRTDSDGQS